MLYREKKIYSGKILEIEIFPISEREKKRSRKAKRKCTEPKQKNLNDKNARKYFIRLINTNFTTKDLAVHLTYSPDKLPQKEEEAKRDIDNFLRRLRDYRKKKGLAPLKYIAVFEYKEPKWKQKAVRMHYHIIVNGDIDRDIIEGLWHKGRANADRLQEDENQFEALARYISKDPSGKKRWTQSKNLQKPKIEPNDSKYKSKRKIENLAKSSDVKEYFENDQKNEYRFLNFEAKYSEEFGWSLYVKMRKNEFIRRGDGIEEFNST